MSAVANQPTTSLHSTSTAGFIVGSQPAPTAPVIRSEDPSGPATRTTLPRIHPSPLKVSSRFCSDRSLVCHRTHTRPRGANPQGPWSHDPESSFASPRPQPHLADPAYEPSCPRDAAGVRALRTPGANSEIGRLPWPRHPCSRYRTRAPRIHLTYPAQLQPQLG